MDRIGEEGKRKEKVKTAVSLLNPFLRTPDLRKLVFCIWNRRPRSARPVNGLLVSFIFL